MEKIKDEISLRVGKHEPDEIPLVSVAMIAYNVGKYLEEAIESVLAQQTNFKVELVIGEDCSTDNTREIALAYQIRYPDVVRVLLHEKNLGLTPNSVATQNACRGKYIALLDGDDYWTDDLKLQKQVEFLEQNTGFSASGHQAEKIFEDGSPSKMFGETVDKVYVLNDTITHRKFHTSSLVYRREYWVKTGGIPENISSNERAIYPMLAIFGKINYFKDSMCVYRITGTGLTSRVDHKELETDFQMIPWLKKISPKFPANKFKSFLHLCNYTYGAKKIPNLSLIRHYLLFAFFSFSYFPRNLGDLKWGTIFFIRKLFNLR
jgi:glycosyltransferase involved in cell wall biosynthesis